MLLTGGLEEESTSRPLQVVRISFQVVVGLRCQFHSQLSVLFFSFQRLPSLFSHPYFTWLMTSSFKATKGGWTSFHTLNLSDFHFCLISLSQSWQKFFVFMDSGDYFRPNLITSAKSLCHILWFQQLECKHLRGIILPIKVNIETMQPHCKTCNCITLKTIFSCIL